MFGEKSDKRFEVVYKQDRSIICKVLADKETGVQYLFCADGYAGGLTVLVDKDGKPIIKKDNQ